MNRAFLQMEMADVKKWLDALVGGAAKILKEHIYAAVESILQPRITSYNVCYTKLLRDC